jgi:hypothetical protein
MFHGTRFVELSTLAHTCTNHLWGALNRCLCNSNELAPTPSLPRVERQFGSRGDERVAAHVTSHAQLRVNVHGVEPPLAERRQLDGPGGRANGQRVKLELAALRRHHLHSAPPRAVS